MAARFDLRLAFIVVFATAALKAVLAARWGLLADEAYYAWWSERLAPGYFDQPPAVAACIAAGRAVFGHSELAVRAHAVLAGAVGALALLPHAKDKAFATFWWVACPPLAWLTLFGTPDAGLLACWSVALAAGIAGGRAWWLAGVATGVGLWVKYPMILVYPLLVASTGDCRDRRAWAGGALALVLFAPHLAWLSANDWVSARFQLGEGVLSPSAPGAWGPPTVLAQQLGVLGPFLALAAVGFWGTRPTDRVGRVAWGTSLPVLAFFLLASPGGPPDAHWVAPAWIGVGLGLSGATARLARLAWFGVGSGLLMSAVLVLHAEVGVFRLRHDPADRLREGRALADSVGAWSLPAGVGPREPGVARAIPVRTERYQEAALIRWHTGIDARKQAGCGRLDEYDRHPVPEVPVFHYVRPRRSGEPGCLSAYPERSQARELEGRDLAGRVVGRWDLFEVGQ